MLAIGLGATAGCRSLSSSAVPAFAAGVTAAKTQSGEAFRSVNDLIAQDQLDDAATATNLSEELFTKVLSTLKT